MRTAKQIEAARRNGAKSRGPVTAAGKSKSAKNSLRHGRYSQNGSEEINTLLRELNATLAEHPSPPPPPASATNAEIEAHLSAQAVWAHEQWIRLLAFEKHLFAAEIDRQRLAQADPDADHAPFFVTGLERLVIETGIPQLLYSLEGVLCRQFEQAAKRLTEFRKQTSAAAKKSAGNEPGESPQSLIPLMDHTNKINLLNLPPASHNSYGVPSNYEQSRLDLRYDAPGWRTVTRLQHERTREAADGGQIG